MVAQEQPSARFLSPSEATAHLNKLGIGIGERTLYRAIEDGSLPAVRAGERKLFVSVEDLEERFLTPIPLRDPVDEYIDDLVAKAPELTQEQRDRLAVLIKDAPVPAGDKAAS